MKQLPDYVPVAFILITFLSVFIFYIAAHKNRSVLAVLTAWLVIQTIPGLGGFFTTTGSLPPRILLLILPPLLLVIGIFSTAGGRAFTDSLDLRTLTGLHTIRIAVEAVLFLLFIYKVMPRLMTFEGRNFDILSGLTAAVVYYFVFVKRKWGAKTLLAWNLICLVVLGFTVGNAVLSVPGPFQQFAFDQPGIAVLYFPFTWLPGMVVPLVYFSHLVAIRRLLKEIRAKRTSRLVITGPLSGIA